MMAAEVKRQESVDAEGRPAFEKIAARIIGADAAQSF